MLNIHVISKKSAHEVYRNNYEKGKALIIKLTRFCHWTVIPAQSIYP